MAFMRDANNLNWAFVCARNQAASTGTVDAAGDILENQVVVLNEANAIVTGALSAGDQFKLAQNYGGELIISPLFTFQSATGTNYAAPQEQVTTIGSDGTTAVFLDPNLTDTTAAATVGDSYYVLIEKQDNDEANRSGYQPAITAQAKLTNPNGITDGGEMNIRLAELLAESIRANDALEASTPSVRGPKYLQVKVKVVATGATAAGEAVAVTHGSKTITFANSGASLDASVVEGSYLSIAGDIYRMATDHASGVVTLDRPFAGVTNAAVASGTGTTQVFALTAAEAQGCTGVGLELTGVAQHDFDVARERLYGVSRFNVRFAKDGENVGGTIATTGSGSSDTPIDGIGDYKQVLTDVYTSMGNQGQRWVSDTPGVERKAPSFVNSSAAGFGVINVAVSVDKKTLFGQSTAKQNVKVYLEYAIAGAGTAQLQTVFGTSIS